MKFREICRFELAYQVRRVSTWVYFWGLFAFGLLIMRAGTPEEGVFLNSPSFIAFFTAMGGVIWLLLAGSVAGDAAARDAETRMDPLTYTLPVSKTDYLGGRFLMNQMAEWTPLERNTRLVALQGMFLVNRVVWIGIALGALAFTYHRFRFAHPFDSLRSLRASPFGSLRSLRASRWIWRRKTPLTDTAIAVSTRISVPSVPRAFGFATYARQTLAFT